MLKRLIEVALPLKEVSEQSAREKSIRHGHISTLHIWWARRPLAACRAAVFASLIPDPDDAECPESFRSLVKEVLSENLYKPKNGDGSTVEDTPRNRCLEYVKHLVRWENSNSPHYIEPARRLIAAAHKVLHPNAEGDVPKVLDPFAGGGAIPLEALRLGCEAHAIDLNPVAHLIELCTLVYPQKYGQPNSRPVPDYIKRLIAHNKKKRRAKGQESADLFAEADEAGGHDEIIPNVEITEAEYLKNPLAADVKYWGRWVLEKACHEVGHLYPTGQDGSKRLAYIWAQALRCPNPLCRVIVPLVKSYMLATRKGRKAAFSFSWDDKNGMPKVHLITEPTVNSEDEGTIQLGSMRCPACKQGILDKNQIKEAARTQGLTLVPICVVVSRSSGGKSFTEFGPIDTKAVEQSRILFDALSNQKAASLSFVPDEPIGRDFEWVLKPPMFGLNKWRDIFTHRQAVVLATFAKWIRQLYELHNGSGDKEYLAAISCLLTMCLGRLADRSAIQCRWRSDGEYVENAYGRQALPMSWDFAELNPFCGEMGDWLSAIEWVHRVVLHCSEIKDTAQVVQGSATSMPLENETLEIVLTDPPYYDAVPYADLSDFFYVWHKRALKNVLTDIHSTPLTPKAKELVQQSEKVTPAERRKKDIAFYESGMQQAFAEMRRVISTHGVVAVMFAHKTTTAWEALIRGLLRSGLIVTASWPMHTEMQARLRAKESAALASSVTLVCRKRHETAGDGLWDDVRQELKPVAKERLDFFWSQGIRGADFFISAIGPALSVFGKYERVTKLTGEEVTVGQFLDEVRSLVTAYALNKIMKTMHTATIDPESRFYVIWKWSYGEAKVPADESFKLAQALGMNTEIMWDRTGVLEKSGENVQAVPVAKRMKIKNLGEPNADSSPASVIDVLHRLCVFREKGDSEGMAEFLGRSGQGRNPNLWLVAQAVSEILPDGDKEKQLMQGLLNQRDQLEKAGEQMKLF